MSWFNWNSTQTVQTNSNRNPKHLIVFVHGFYGLPRGFNYSSQMLQQHLGEDALTFISTCNSSFIRHGTQDGIDSAGSRLANEVRGVVSSNPSLQTISFVGMSLGGLISRYAIGELYQETSDSQSNPTVAGLKPNSFISFASPHLGTRGGVSWIVENVLSYFPIFKATTDQLFYRDIRQSSKQPLLVEMTDPNSSFFKGLASFKHRILYTNVEADHRVIYQTGAIWPYPLEGEPWKKPYKYHEDYKHVIHRHEELDISHAKDLKPFYSLESDEWKAAQNLLQLSWKRYDCHFDGWFASSLNHNNIIVNFETMNSIGKPVVDHFVKHFQLE